MPHYYQSSARKKDAPFHVFIATPTYADLKVAYVDSLNKVQHHLLANRVSFDIAFLWGNCHVDDGRNDLCRMFLESEATHLMFIDADLQFSAASVLTLLKHDEDIVGGVYPYKNDDEGYPVIFTDEGYVGNEKGLIPVKGLPGGFMCIKRKVIEKLYKKAAEKGAWPNKGNYGTTAVTEIFFRSIEKGRSRRSGDYEFCAHAIKRGFGMYMDPTLRFGHIGDKIWEGSAQRFFLGRSGVLGQIARDSLHNLDTAPTKQAFEHISIAYDNAQFAVDSVLLGMLWKTVKDYDCKSFLETGSGASTAVLSKATDGRGSSLEHSAIWGAKTEEYCRQLDVPCTVEYSPLTKYPCGEWYEVSVTDSQKDLIFIDGPVRKVGGERIRICDVIPDTIAKAKVIVVDDTDDTDGRKVLDRLRDEFGFTFELYEGGRREFAIGYKESANAA